MPPKAESTLTPGQTAYLKTLEPDFRSYVVMHSNGAKDSAEKAAKTWKDTHTNDILSKIKSDYPYPSTWTRETTDGKVKSYIRRFFGNCLQGTLVRTGALKTGLGDPANNAIFNAPRPLTARQLYAEAQKDEVLTLAGNLKDEIGGNTAACYQTALKTLWSTTEDDTKAKYEEEARTQALDIDVARNQRDFESHIGGTLQDLCTNGALGPAEMVLLASFRTTTGDLSTFVVHGHSDENQRSFADFLPNFPSVRSQWDTFSAEVLPRHSLQDQDGWDTIPRNSAGIPVFPAVDFDNTTRSGLAQILDLFLRVCWDHTWPSDEAYNGLPYAELAKRPDHFYDTGRFVFQPMLGIPMQEMSLSQLSGIVEHLISISLTASPFIFREKAEILTLQKASVAAASIPFEADLTPPRSSSAGDDINGDGSGSVPPPPPRPHRPLLPHVPSSIRPRANTNSRPTYRVLEPPLRWMCHLPLHFSRARSGRDCALRAGTLASGALISAGYAIHRRPIARPVSPPYAGGSRSTRAGFPSGRVRASPLCSSHTISLRLNS
ncbi:hypothetical protein B0H17DRAFT_1213790 [Mycena rosella]|uniref:Uncharacterized protein n=1 Tax=Mycena rosella TaxID=1033263 RepID=A0AAD7CPG6_MYCRO|nr:hypothetical protein B0H17DRAFT_1213790 [Mycena rosella]